MSVITIENGSLCPDLQKCVSCGRCEKACRKGAMQIRDQGFTIFVGGKVGKKPRMGDDGERPGDVIDLCGMARFRETVK